MSNKIAALAEKILTDAGPDAAPMLIYGNRGGYRGPYPATDDGRLAAAQAFLCAPSPDGVWLEAGDVEIAYAPAESEEAA